MRRARAWKTRVYFSHAHYPDAGRTRPWRDIARPIIARVLHETKGMDARVIRKALRDAYPFGPRKYWPYRVWIDEVARQQGRKRRVRNAPDPRQLELFGES